MNAALHLTAIKHDEVVTLLYNGSGVSMTETIEGPQEQAPRCSVVDRHLTRILTMYYATV